MTEDGRILMRTQNFHKDPLPTTKTLKRWFELLERFFHSFFGIVDGFWMSMVHVLAVQIIPIDET